MTTRGLIVGLDGADRNLIVDLGSKRLPTFHRLMRQGAHAAIKTVEPPATLPNWTTFLTGLDPGMHGVFDFTTREKNRIRFTAGTVREAPTLFQGLDALGLCCACIGFPGTWPPERLKHGIFISGWDSPVAFEADRSFVWPPGFYDELRERFGPPRFDDVGEFDAATPGWHERLPDALIHRIEKKTQLARWILQQKEWDLFAFYFGESDTAAHHLWAHYDSGSPRHSSCDSQDGLSRVYIALDQALSKILDAAGDGVEITLISDHGFGGASDKVLYLNRMLADAGLLAFRDSSQSFILKSLAGKMKDIALTQLPPRLKERLFRARGAFLPSWLETQARFGCIDFERTIAFSDELNYFPGVWIHHERLKTQQEYMRAIGDTKEALHALRDPWTGRNVVDQIWHRDELYVGPYVNRAPDLLLKLHLDQSTGSNGYSYNLMPSSSAPRGTGSWRRLERHEHLGRKGRSLPGSHRDRGFFVAAGPQIAPIGDIEANIADASATLLARMNVAVPAEAAGRVLWEILVEQNPKLTRSLPESSVVKGKGNEAIVEERLRALGYID